MVKSKIDFIIEEIDMFYFLDVMSIHSFNKLSSEKHPLVPTTLTLLDKYGVTKEQFVKDSEGKGFVAIPNQLQA